jgi:hypothetical protein
MGPCRTAREAQVASPTIDREEAVSQPSEAADKYEPFHRWFESPLMYAIREQAHGARSRQVPSSSPGS